MASKLSYSAPTSLRRMRYWWVNQNQTYRHEVRGSFMWSPKRKKDGSANPFYDTMRQVQIGDIVLSFCDTFIRAIGLVAGVAQTGPKPDFGSVGWNWSDEGWFVPVDYCGVEGPIRPKDHIELLRPFLPEKYSPLQVSGDGKQSVYLAEIPGALADALVALMGNSYHQALAALADLPSSADPIGIDEITEAAIGPMFREQIVRARRGQGVFRANVLLKEPCCRVTHVDEPRHLKASHIKPWSQSSDAERLDGSNGLLLSPHIDHLFVRGYITFSRSQELIVVPEVRVKLLDAWGIDAGVRVGEFSRDQGAYLDYHRTNVFRRELLNT